MGNLDLKFYWAVFLRRLPYFILVSGFIAALGVTVAAILPPVYVSGARILVEPQQISDDLAQSTVPIDPYEQIQIIQQRVLTRANLLDLAEKSQMFADSPDASAEDIIKSMAGRITFTGSEPRMWAGRAGAGAIVVRISFEAPNAVLAARGANEVVNLILAENVRIRSERATGTSDFFETEVEKLSESLQEKAREIAEFKTENVEALPDSLEARRQQQLIEQERLLALEREETSLRNERATAIWVYERTGRSGTFDTRTPEEEQLEALKSERLQKLAIYSPSSAAIRVLDHQINNLEQLVEEQRQTRATPESGDGSSEPATELDLELAPIDARLEFITQEKQMIENTLAELQASIATTPRNEMVLNSLESEMQNLNQRYEEASARLAQARVGERIELSSRGQRLTLIEQPIESPYPESPNRKLIAMAGVAGGVGAGLGIVVLLEMLNRSIRRSVDLSTHLGLQPLATIPYIRTRRERRVKRTLIALALFLIFVIIPLGLFMLHTYYMPLDLLISELKSTLRGEVPAPPAAVAPPS